MIITPKKKIKKALKTDKNLKHCEKPYKDHHCSHNVATWDGTHSVRRWVHWYHRLFKHWSDSWRTAARIIAGQHGEAEPAPFWVIPLENGSHEPCLHVITCVSIEFHLDIYLYYIYRLCLNVFIYLFIYIKYITVYFVRMEYISMFGSTFEVDLGCLIHSDWRMMSCRSRLQPLWLV